MEELLKTAGEFFDSGEENIRKKRYNPAVADFFKAVVILCDYLIYKEIKIIPKNHNDRFLLLERYFQDIHKKVSGLFKTYTQSYNLRLSLTDAQTIRNYAYELKNLVSNKK